MSLSRQEQLTRQQRTTAASTNSSPMMKRLVDNGGDRQQQMPAAGAVAAASSGTLVAMQSPNMQQDRPLSEPAFHLAYGQGTTDYRSSLPLHLNPSPSSSFSSPQPGVLRAMAATRQPYTGRGSSSPSIAAQPQMHQPQPQPHTTAKPLFHFGDELTGTSSVAVAPTNFSPFESTTATAADRQLEQALSEMVVSEAAGYRSNPPVPFMQQGQAAYAYAGAVDEFGLPLDDPLMQQYTPVNHVGQQQQQLQQQQLQHEYYQQSPVYHQQVVHQQHHRNSARSSSSAGSIIYSPAAVASQLPQQQQQHPRAVSISSQSSSRRGSFSTNGPGGAASTPSSSGQTAVTTASPSTSAANAANLSRFHGVHKPGNLASLLSYEDTLELYRQNARKTNDPQTQLDFALYLLQIAETIEVQPGDKQARKARERLMEEGVKWVKRLATSGLGLGRPAFPEAQFLLAECYGNGSLAPVLEIDHDRAFNLYVQASKQNHAAATYRAAVCYELGAGPRKDHARAVQFYRKSAALGNTSGMFKLAMILLHGAMGAPKNEREGVTWLKRAAVAADATNPEALHELALVYERGEVPSVIKDEAHARELYTKASQFGYAPSQYRLGKAYEYAELTCEMDARRSISWYTRAAEQGFPEAELALSCWYLIGAAGILELNETEAYLWARKAAEKGLAKAEYTVGYYSEVGIGTQKDLDEAVRFYTKAAANGNERARTRLADLKKASQMQRRRNNGGGAGAYKGSRDGGDDACNIM